MLERKHWEWIQSGKSKDRNRIPVDPDQYVAFDKMLLIDSNDPSNIHGVRRGEKGERLSRPSDDKYMDNSNFLPRKFIE